MSSATRMGEGAMWLLHDLLDRSPGLATNNEALRHQGRSLLYKDLVSLSLRCASGLTRLGVQRGDRVVIALQNRPEVIEVALACSRLGAVFVPISPTLKPRQLLHILRDSGATTLVTSATALPKIIPLCAEELVRVCNIVFTDTLEIESHAHERPDLVAIDDLRDVETLDTFARSIDQDLAAIMYTSGSTGHSKGVMLSHRNLVAGATIVADYLENRATDRILVALPLSFDYGFSQVTTALRVGACAILTSFSTSAALIQQAATDGATGLAGVPTMWAHFASVPLPRELSRTLRYVTNSGGALHASLIQLLRAKLPNTLIYCMYGLTEAFRSTYLPPDEIDARPGSIGKAIQNQEIVVLRPDGTLCEAGEVGELVHRGSLVSLGYWGDPDATAARYRMLPAHLARGSREELAVWSGDLAHTDEDGYLYFVARADHMIKTSGYRVSPTEIEEVVCEVQGILEAVALGIEDPMLGQRIIVVATVQASSNEILAESVRRHCRMQLAPYMTPSELRIVHSIPRNANGKPDRRLLLESVETNVDFTIALYRLSD